MKAPSISDDKIAIHVEEYNKLRWEHELLATLRAYGVDQWEHWDKAIKILEEIKEGNNGNG